VLPPFDSGLTEGASVRPVTNLLGQLAALHRLELAGVPDDRRASLTAELLG
jgi:hypothetical protein